MITALKIRSTVNLYVKLMRIDHWFKNIFIIPGVILALIHFKSPVTNYLVFVGGLLSACLLASANYVINEWLDAKFDKFHPIKKNRPSVTNDLNPNIIYIMYFSLLAVGLFLAFLINYAFFVVAILFVISGIAYNIQPFRTKDKVYLDVLSESLNNPIRFAFGWFMILPYGFEIGMPISWEVLPPASMMVAYWMGGAFLMAAKRLAEYKYINNPQTAGLYRNSFKSYTEIKLLLSAFFYALTSTFFLGIFLIKNKIELLLSFPFLAGLFTWYLYIAYKNDSTAQRPEKLYGEKKFLLYILLLVTLMSFLLMIKIPALSWFLNNTFLNQ